MEPWQKAGFVYKSNCEESKTKVLQAHLFT